MPEFKSIVAEHDAAIDNAGLSIWVGSEPTFTLRSSEAPQWLSQPLGDDKEEYALRIVRDLHIRHPGSLILRTVGRQYDGEELPRWSYGLYERRDGQALWSGPSDPVINDLTLDDSNHLEAFSTALQQQLDGLGWSCRHLGINEQTNQASLLARIDAGDLDAIDADDQRFARASPHEQKTPHSGLVDELAQEGYLLFRIDALQIRDGQRVLAVELPLFPEVDSFQKFLRALGVAAKITGLEQMQLCGMPPPVDYTVAWTTVTPDPAVIEINQAPQPDISSFLHYADELYRVTQDLGLSPYRLDYNGSVSDSGGGGQFTLGGRTAESSPFFTSPRLLPRLVRYFILHPSLAYLFATNYVGGNSQSPRPDEGNRDAFEELSIALDQLESSEEITPGFLHDSLAPFLADSSGNSHRSELNIEKLWNSSLPQRGCLGLVEFRAFCMPFSPLRSVSIALLLRSITAMLAHNDIAPQLKRWDEELHDRFALPYFLRADLAKVLRDIAQSGFALSQEVSGELLTDSHRSVWSFNFPDGKLCIEQAIEFWPLVGDGATQEHGGSRLVDSSTQRLQISMLGLDDGDRDFYGWQLQVDRYLVPLRDQQDENGKSLRLLALRFRDYMPWRGLHPSIKPTSPLLLYLSHPERVTAYEIKLFNWRPNSTPYDGLPDDLDDARTRRQERLQVMQIDRQQVPEAQTPPDKAVSAFTLDLRRL